MREEILPGRQAASPSSLPERMEDREEPASFPLLLLPLLSFPVSHCFLPSSVRTVALPFSLNR